MSNSRMNARERIESLLDANSFVELGAQVTARNTDYNLGSKKAPGDGVITGYGVLGDRMVYVYAQDASVLGGSIGEMHAKKIVNMYDLAMRTGVPIVGMIDCAGLRLQEALDALHAFGTIFKKQVEASGKIPQILGVFGMCGGGSAVMTRLADFTFVEEESGSIFVNSPNAVDGNAESVKNTASADYQAGRAGNADFVCKGEEEMLSKMRELLSLLPSAYNTEDQVSECKDNLNRVISVPNQESYDVRALLKEISDQHLYLEPRAAYGKHMVTAFIRLNGETVGVVANDLNDEGHAVLCRRGLNKATRFLRFCDAFQLPILTVTNVDGLSTKPGEESGLAQSLAAFAAELVKSNVAKVNLITGDAFGTAGLVMNSKAMGADLVLAWKDARIGVMDAVEAVRIMYADEINSAEDQLAVIEEKSEQYEQDQESVLAAAKRGYVDDIIEPDATRKRLIAAYEMLTGKYVARPEKKHTSI